MTRGRSRERRRRDAERNLLGFLAAALARRSDPTYVDAVGRTMNSQLACDRPSDVDAIHASLVGAGYPSHTAPWDAFWGQRFARVIDPDGRVVNLSAPLSE